MRMSILAILCGFVVAGCAAAPPPEQVRQSCLSQGLEPGRDGFQACVEANGAEIATGPGSPWAYDQKLED